MKEMIKDTTAIILAGGKGRRMNESNKGLMLFGKKPLIAHVIARIKPQVADILISANAEIAQYQSFGYPVISDQLMEFQGPLAGIESALKSARTKYAVVLPCDSPFIPMDFVQRMARDYVASKADVVIVHDGKRTQPLFMFLPVELKHSLEKSLRQGVRKVYSWLEGLKIHAIDYSDQTEAFININTPNDLKQAEEKL
jgi:molybdenum cofactor guanylyltransferase